MAFSTTTPVTWNDKFKKVQVLYVSAATFAHSIAPTDQSGTRVPFQLVEIRVKYSASTTENMTLTLDAGNGAAYDALLHTFDNSAGATGNFYNFANEMRYFNATDEIDVAWTDGAKTAGVEVLVRIPYGS